MRPIVPPKKALLIVDDDADVLSSLETLLARELPGVRILTAASGAEGMVIVKSEPLDMILADFGMPIMDGVEFLRQARLLQTDIPMVIMSADANPELAAHARRSAGVAMMFPKPFDLERLLAMLNMVFRALPRATRRATRPPGPALVAVVP
ncbi:MAG: response regulator [Euryarchaeota archaeon]|nr:response regulator [Euryarchaeota archaeon]